MTHVPYKSIAPMMNDILGNQIPLGLAGAGERGGQCEGRAAQDTRGHEREALVAVSRTCRRSRKRASPATTCRRGTACSRRPGTPDAIVDKIHADVVKVAQTKEFVDQMQPQALEVELLGPAAYKAFLVAELDKWSKLVKSSGAKVD